MRIEYHPATITDLNEAVKFYNQRQPGLGDKFREDVYASIDRIQANPKVFTQVDDIRRALLKRFPYSVVYRLIEHQTIRILVIRHHRRRPEFGTGRQ